MKYATIVGSRHITSQEFVTLREIATKLSYRGYILRSGAADGADSTINHLCDVEIILPWNGFNRFKHDGKRIWALEFLPSKSLAEQRAKAIHPRPDLLTATTLKFHTRNMYQVIGPLGIAGIKSEILVYCSDEDATGEPIGGTRTAVMYARQLGIETFNIRNKGFDASELITRILGRIEANREVASK